MSDISGLGDARQIPQQPPQQSEQNQTQLADAVNLFTDLIQAVASLTCEKKQGGRSHG